MSRIRRCDKRCHSAKGSRCRCWCGGAFHGSAGATNRQILQAGAYGLLEQHGFKIGETAYIEQTNFKDIVASIPERIGAGFAHAFLEGKS